MERRITEEKVTKVLLNWLEKNNWEIISYDFPQSGTGVCIHPNANFRTTKNRDSFIPDIVAHKNNTIVIFENKDRFVLDDFIKVSFLKETILYSESLSNLLKDYKYSNIFYGIGMPSSKNNITKTNQNIEKVDYVLMLNHNNIVQIHYDPINIFRDQTSATSIATPDHS